MIMGNATIKAIDQSCYSLYELATSFETKIKHESTQEEAFSGCTVSYQEISKSETPATIIKVLTRGFKKHRLKYFVGNDGTFKAVASRENRDYSIYFNEYWKSRKFWFWP